MLSTTATSTILYDYWAHPQYAIAEDLVGDYITTRRVAPTLLTVHPDRPATSSCGHCVLRDRHLRFPCMERRRSPSPSGPRAVSAPGTSPRGTCCFSRGDSRDAAAKRGVKARLGVFGLGSQPVGTGTGSQTERVCGARGSHVPAML